MWVRAAAPDPVQDGMLDGLASIMSQPDSSHLQIAVLMHISQPEYYYTVHIQ